MIVFHQPAVNSQFSHLLPSSHLLHSIYVRSVTFAFFNLWNFQVSIVSSRNFKGFQKHIWIIWKLIYEPVDWTGDLPFSKLKSEVDQVFLDCDGDIILDIIIDL